jgi:rsbT co-antagonist protein RsbR
MKKETVITLQRKKQEILKSWIENQLKEDGLRQSLMSSEDQGEVSGELLDIFLESLPELSSKDTESRSFEKIYDFLAGISIARAKQGFTPRETGAYIFSLKETMLEALSNEIKDAVTLYEESMEMDKLLDNMVMATFETFIKGREEVILRQTDEMAEISTPVIRVWDGVLALPIIGTLDSSRTQVVMENLLQEIVETGSSIAILDISGVPSVDSMVAQHLIKTVSATRLMGAECIISGIRPEIAQTVVHLGIDLSNIVTKSTMASALKTAFSMLQLDVNKRQKIVK